jgi:hypothetical protein
VIVTSEARSRWSAASSRAICAWISRSSMRNRTSPFATVWPSETRCSRIWPSMRARTVTVAIGSIQPTPVRLIGRSIVLATAETTATRGPSLRARSPVCTGAGGEAKPTSALASRKAS